MRKLTLLIACALTLLCAACVVAQQPAEDKTQCYTTWDDNYFYLSFRVDCPDVQSRHSSPNSEVTGDDAVIVFIETNNKHADSITPSCFSMAVSAGGGAQFSAGTENGKLEPMNVLSFKYGSTVQGTLNNNDDIDTGYSVEMALPWSILNTKPPRLGDMMSFNIIVRRNGWKAGDMASLAPRVKTEEDILSPSKWANLVYAAFAFVATSGGEKVLSVRNIVSPPLINGVVDDREWPKNGTFALKMPVPVGFVYEAKFPIQRMVLAPYYYTWQRDPRKRAAFTDLKAPDGGVSLQNFPDESIGPWFSWDRVRWHREQATDAIAAGIDVLLPAYRGDKTSRESFALKGLDCLVGALMELKGEGRPYPLVGMLFDCSSIQATNDQLPDLREEKTRQAFYGMIKEFFDRVPPELRAFAQTAKPKAGGIAPLVFLSAAECVSGLDDAVIQYANQRFEQDFGSALVWIAPAGSSGLSAADGTAALRVSPTASCDTDSRIRICTVSPGYNDSAVAAKNSAVIHPRLGGEAYEKAWAQAIESNPHWVVCNSWNDFARGTGICASREYGRKYIDATLASTQQMLGKNEFDAQYLTCFAPSVIAGRGIAQAEITIRNAGTSPWRASDGFALGYRWYRSGRYVCESKVRRQLDKDILPGETVVLPIGIATVDMNSVALPDSNYELRFEMIRLSDNKWFSALGDQPLIVPLTVGRPPEWRASYVSCDAPVMAASGQAYPAKVRIRNDGSSTWSKGRVKLGYKLYKVSSFTHDGADLSEVVPTTDVRVLLQSDCKPGEIATFLIPLDFRQADKKPLPVWSPEAGWSYQISFDIYNGENWLSELDSSQMRRTIDLFESDYGARVFDSNLPKQLQAGQSYTAKVVVRNNGITTWDRKKTGLGYHWYHLDGNQLQWDCVPSPFDADVKPGMPTVLNAKVKAPEYDGQYILLWDVRIGDVWLSTLDLTRGNDVLPVFVEVINGKLAFADLGSICDLNATSPETNRTSGDFDGKGSSFPAEYFPPDAGKTDQSSRVFPSGYKWTQESQPDGRISFVFAEKTQGTKSAVSCKGQKVVVDRAHYIALHIAAASVDGQASGELSINYTDGAETSRMAVSDWSTGASHGESVVCATRHRHNHGGDEANRHCYIYHYTIRLDEARTLTSITLPTEARIRVVAMTLERAQLPPLRESAPAK